MQAARRSSGLHSRTPRTCLGASIHLRTSHSLSTSSMGRAHGKLRRLESERMSHSMLAAHHPSCYSTVQHAVLLQARERAVSHTHSAHSQDCGFSRGGYEWVTFHSILLYPHTLCHLILSYLIGLATGTKILGSSRTVRCSPWRGSLCGGLNPRSHPNRARLVTLSESARQTRRARCTPIEGLYMDV